MILGNVTLILIGVNLAGFVARSLFPRAVLYGLAMIPFRVSSDLAVWQFATYMFVHANMSHLLFNMLGLFFFGGQVEERMGSREFLNFYLVAGIAAGLFSFAVYSLTGNERIILLGASGAVYAVLLAFAVYFPYANIYVMGIIPVRAPILVAVYAGIELYSQVLGVRGGVAHLTHLAGLAAAWLYFLFRLRIDPMRVFFGRGRY